MEEQIAKKCLDFVYQFFVGAHVVIIVLAPTVETENASVLTLRLQYEQTVHTD